MDASYVNMYMESYKDLYQIDTKIEMNNNKKKRDFIH